MLPVCHDARGAEELVGEETPGEVALPLKVFEPSKNGSPLGQKMDEPWAYVPRTTNGCAAQHWRRFPTFHLKIGRSLTQFTSDLLHFPSVEAVIVRSIHLEYAGIGNKRDQIPFEAESSSTLAKKG